MDNIEYPIYNPIDASWLALLIIGIIMFCSSIGAFVLLYFFWRRYQKTIPLNSPNYIVKHLPDPNLQINDRQPQAYETQKMQVYLPANDDDRNLGEIHTRFTPQDGVQDVHQIFDRTTRAYF